eukprot:TRINITY_DN9677_c0_g1_i1.p1 TRINITY_DN9677_c0_g1~~TRINITY_DN9677_c0_g1_i1.p1  ORF type:complete len:675 (+),score=148.03 TRINITY_DN9677_c0_g1_i1:3-2027(+)
MALQASAETVQPSQGDAKAKPQPKLVRIYDALFKGENPGTDAPNFWDEFFLLKVNTTYLEGAITRWSPEQTLALKSVVQVIVSKAILKLQDSNDIRIANALATIGVMFRAMFAKNLSQAGFDVVSVLFGLQDASSKAQKMLAGFKFNLFPERPALILDLTLRVLTVIATASDNVHENKMLEYLMQYDVASGLVRIVREPEMRVLHGKHACFLLTCLLSYRRKEAHNPYAAQLEDLSDDVTLHGFGAVLVHVLNKRNRQWAGPVDSAEQGGFLYQISSMVADMFVTPQPNTLKVPTSATLAALVLLFFFVHHNKHSTVLLAHTPLAHNAPVGPDTDDHPDTPVAEAQPPAATGPGKPTSTNLFGTLVTFASFMLQDTTNESIQHAAALCFTILNIVCEDPHINTFLHDPNIKVPIVLHRAAMRHRPETVDTLTEGPLAVTLLELCIELIMSHMRKKLDVAVYTLSLNVIHRLLCFEKQSRVRLSFKWQRLWNALVAFLKFLNLQDEESEAYDIFALANRVVIIFNLFVTYGDTFLPDPDSYDELYYELIRERKTFDALFESAKRHTRTSGVYAATANKLANSLINIRAIVSHFGPKVEAWSAANKHEPMSPENVLAIVRDNYDTLTLKLQDGLDLYDAFREDPDFERFLNQLLRDMLVRAPTLKFQMEPIFSATR